MYQVVARKYRPQRFADIVGQDAIVATLKNALRFRKLAHAYLFCGSKGTGKTTLARVFAKALNCEKCTEDFEPCNQCSSCQEIANGRSLDVLEIDGASNRGIDDIRQINETVGYTSASGKYKIYIIDEVHMLTKEAFNALLKTLEEPPAHVKFFFATTEPHKVLPTIISRCQRFELHRISIAAIVGKLSWIAQDLQLTFEPDAIQMIAQMADGSLRDAQSLFDQVICFCSGPLSVDAVSTALSIPPRALFSELDKAIGKEDLSFAFTCAEQIFEGGKDLSYFCDSLLEHFRNHLHSALNHPGSTPYTIPQLLHILDFLIAWTQKILKSPFKRVGLEMLLLHLIRSKHRITIDDLIGRLNAFESNLPHSAAPVEKTEVAPVEIKREPIKVEPPVAELKAEPVVEVKAEAPPAVIEVKEEAPAPIVEPITPAPVIEARTAKKTKIEPVEPSLEEKLLSAIKSKEQEPVVVPIIKETNERPQFHYDTILRFAAVELEGTVKLN